MRHFLRQMLPEPQMLLVQTDLLVEEVAARDEVRHRLIVIEDHAFRQSLLQRHLDRRLTS